MFHCERCGRQAGIPMLDCPERILGSCIYTVQRNRLNRSVGIMLLLAGIASGLFDFLMLIFLLLSPRSTTRLTDWLVMAAVMTVFTGIILAMGTYSTMGEESTLYNAETGQMWQRRSLGRLEIRQTAIRKLEPLPLDAYLNLPRNWPASLSALLEDTPTIAGLDTPENQPGVVSMLAKIARSPAAYLVEAALLGLLADQRICLYQAHGQRSYLGRTPTRVTEYFAKPGEVSWQGAEGWLEQRILYVVKCWPQYKEARDWPQGAPIHALVKGIYQRNQTNPGGWLIRQVQEDAVKRGLGTLHGRLRPRFDPNPDLAGQLAGEARSVRAVYAQLNRVYPEVMRELDSKVRSGIASRQENTG